MYNTISLKAAQRLHFLGSVESDFYYFSTSNYMLLKTTQALHDLICKDLKNSYDKSSIKLHEREYLETFYKKALQESTVEKKQTKRLEKLTIITANSCNLGCKYCYVDGGKYDKSIEDPLMSNDTAKALVDYAYKKFDEVARVSFFGGEPLLNFTAIEYTVNYIQSLFEKGIVKKLPMYSITTNGTIYSSRIYKFFDDNNFRVCISIDGDKDIHDALRPFLNGKGSFKKIASNVENIKTRHQNIALSYSTTYTKLHHNLNLKIDDIRKIIEEKIGLKYGSIVPAMDVRPLEESYAITDNDLYNLLSEDKDRIWNTFLEGDPIIDTEIMNFLVLFVKKGKSKRICEMGYELLTINSKGDIYPCQTLLNNQEMVIGNIFFDENENAKLFEEYSNKVLFTNKFENEKCKNCIAINFCQGCPSRWYYEKNLLEPWDFFCKSVKEQTQETLMKIIKLQREPKLWESFVHSMSKLEEKIEYLQS